MEYQPERRKSDCDDQGRKTFFYEVHITDRVAWNFELVSNVAGYHSKYPVISSSFKFIVPGHTFSIIFSNSQYVSADGIVSNSPRGFGDTIIGFNITREFHF